MTISRNQFHFNAPLATVALLVLCLCLIGCRSALDLAALKRGDDTSDHTNIDDIQGPLERLIRPISGTAAANEDDGSYRPPKGLTEFERAEQIYKDGQHQQAEKALKKIVKKYKDSSVKEDAQFLLAEAQFQQKRYAQAQDSYGRLLKDFPSTRYLNQSTRRLFSIARVWLEFPNVATSEDIQPVNFDDPQSTPLPKSDHQKSRSPSRVVPILPNFFDRTRPLFDTSGRALQALRSIWMNDPTGALADDALMLTASHYLRKGDYMEADRNFTILRKEYPKSPHLENAYILGAHVKLMSYQGAQYDGKNLEEARKLNESAQKLFPNSSKQDRLHRELKQIDEVRARRDWEMVRYYLRRKNQKGAAIYSQLVIDNFPNSAYADQARQVLAELGPGSHTNDAQQQPGESEAVPMAINPDDVTGRART